MSPIFGTKDHLENHLPFDTESQHKALRWGEAGDSVTEPYFTSPLPIPGPKCVLLEDFLVSQEPPCSKTAGSALFAQCWRQPQDILPQFLSIITHIRICRSGERDSGKSGLRTNTAVLTAKVQSRYDSAFEIPILSTAPIYAPATYST